MRRCNRDGVSPLSLRFAIGDPFASDLPAKSKQKARSLQGIIPKILARICRLSESRRSGRVYSGGAGRFPLPDEESRPAGAPGSWQLSDLTVQRGRRHRAAETSKIAVIEHEVDD